MAEDPWNAHISYLEDEVKNLDERAAELEATIRDLENEQKKHALREFVKHLRDEASEHRCLASTISSGQRRLFFPVRLMSIAAAEAVGKW